MPQENNAYCKNTLKDTSDHERKKNNKIEKKKVVDR